MAEDCGNFAEESENLVEIFGDEWFDE